MLKFTVHITAVHLFTCVAKTDVTAVPRIFRDSGSKGKILLGSRCNYFEGSGEINALFSGIKGAQTPLGGLINGLVPLFPKTPGRASILSICSQDIERQ